MRSIALLVLTAVTLPGCDSPPPQPQQDNLVNATQSDQAFPSSASGNDVISGEDTTAPAANAQ